MENPTQKHYKGISDCTMDKEKISFAFIVGLAMILLALNIALSTITNAQDNESSWSLKQVLLIHRHGDRTPITFPSGDPLKEKPFWKLVGLSSLTNEGKARLYKLGLFIRGRYADFLTDNRHETLSRSSAAERCLESGQLFLSGLYRPQLRSNQIWDNTQENPLAEFWLPMQIRSAPIQYDGMLAEGCKCNKLSDEYLAINGSSIVKELYRKYDDLSRLMQREIGQEYPIFFHWFWSSSLIDIERQYFANELSAVISDSYSLIDAAGKEAMAAWISTDTSKRLRTGLLLNDMLQHLANFQDNLTKTKFVHYSSHDLNIVALLSVLNLFENGQYPFQRPGYGSSFIVELHMERDSQEKILKFFYLPEAGGHLQEAHVRGCSKLSQDNKCRLESLVSILKPYTISSWNQWMQECNNNNTQTVDIYAD